MVIIQWFSVGGGGGGGNGSDGEGEYSVGGLGVASAGVFLVVSIEVAVLNSEEENLTPNQR